MKDGRTMIIYRITVVGGRDEVAVTDTRECVRTELPVEDQPPLNPVAAALIDYAVKAAQRIGRVRRRRQKS